MIFLYKKYNFYNYINMTDELFTKIDPFTIIDISLIVAGTVSMIINIALLTLYFIYRKKKAFQMRKGGKK